MNKHNTFTGNLLTDLSWQQLPFENNLSKFILYVEGDDIELFIGAGAPVGVNAFKVPASAAFEWPSTIQDVWIRGVDTQTVVYFIS